MYTLISDYDGTFKPFDNNPNIIEKYIFKHNNYYNKKGINI